MYFFLGIFNILFHSYTIFFKNIFGNCYYFCTFTANNRLPKKMIVVSGSARCGTSMMMQTLVHLGIPTPAKPFIEEHSLILDKNPKGFYELYDEVANGIQHDRYKGMAVKIFPGCLIQTPKEYISKMIVMKRDREEAIQSYEPIRNKLEVQLTSEYIYDANYCILDNYIFDVQHIFVIFADMVTNPKKEIMKIIDFLDIKPTKKQIDNAIKNIDICHY